MHEGIIGGFWSESIYLEGFTSIFKGSSIQISNKVGVTNELESLRETHIKITWENDYSSAQSNEKIKGTLLSSSVKVFHLRLLFRTLLQSLLDIRKIKVLVPT